VPEQWGKKDITTHSLRAENTGKACEKEEMGGWRKVSDRQNTKRLARGNDKNSARGGVPTGHRVPNQRGKNKNSGGGWETELHKKGKKAKKMNPIKSGADTKPGAERRGSEKTTFTGKKEFFGRKLAPT